MAVKVTKADGAQVFRLRDIETEEVSIVDRPANQVPFLVVKRDANVEPTKKDSSGSTGKTGTKKAGAKMSKENFGKLTGAIEALLSLQGALAPQIKAAEESKPKKKAVKRDTGEGGDEKRDELSKRLDQLNEKVTKQDKTIATQGGTIGKLRKQLRDQESLRGDMPGSSQALDVEFTQRAPQDPDRVTWPRDLNEPEPKYEF